MPGMGTGLRRCGGVFGGSIVSGSTNESSEWIRTLGSLARCPKLGASLPELINLDATR